MIDNSIFTAGNNIDKPLKEMAHIVAKITSIVKYVEKKVEMRLKIAITLIAYRYLYNMVLSILQNYKLYI